MTPVNFQKLEQLGQKERERQDKFERRIFCCNSTACLSAGAAQTRAALEEATQEEPDTGIVKTGCMGLCSRGPLVRIESKDEASVLVGDVTPDIAAQIVSFPATQAEASLESHIIPPDLPFFAKQVRVVLSQTGHIDPDKLEDSLAHGGYKALAYVLENMTPEEVCDLIQESGLRGRGGAGFPTGLKWHFTRREEGAQKYVIVNGDEGDPGAYMDRTVMEDDPHRVLEGMMICAYAVGASFGYFYIRGEYPIAIQRIRRAIIKARQRGILGKSVLGTDFNFNADIRIGAGAFVCGEETALIHSIEGQRGIPRIRPPYPSQSGLKGKPTVINNVETMANVPSIINNGADWYASIGTRKSKGTKVFALAGQLRQTGLIEVPMGITLGEIVNEIGGGIANDGRFKAAQTGGPSGGCIPNTFLDSPVDYESLAELGSIMGSGGLVVLDDTTMMPNFARFFMDFCVDESCGKCVPCRVGTVKIRGLLDKIIGGTAVPEDLDKLEKLCLLVKKTSLCGLGQSAPNPVLSTLNYFRHEYEQLIQVEEILHD
jgi:bidirectional [NiFe] hydrogenase diaphorase subunit